MHEYIIQPYMSQKFQHSYSVVSPHCFFFSFRILDRHLAMNTLISLFKTPLHNECISKETKPVPMFYFKIISKVMMGNVKGKDPDS